MPSATPESVDRKARRQPKRKIGKILIANRGEIAIRLMRAASELGIETVAIYSKEDSGQLFRQKATESYQIGEGQSPVGAYLNIDEIVKVAVKSGADAVHPGYGFLSERADFAKAVEDAGLIFIGPHHVVVDMMGNKTHARKLAINTGVPVIPGTEVPLMSYTEALPYVETIGLPVILKAAYGGGGRGMRIVRNMSELEDEFNTATSEAAAAFGNGAMFVERYVENPRHIEVQIMGDKKGNIVHLFERDCSVQRRYQKVVEIAPAPYLDSALRETILADAVKLAKAANYYNAGTVEFLIDSQGRHYFIEVNARLQVEHTVTEEVTGIDLVQTQIRVAEGHSLPSLKLTQRNIKLSGSAIQVRVTTEDPRNGFRPATGQIDQYLSADGMGIRVDAGSGFSGAEITPFYDSLLAKVIGKGKTFGEAAVKLNRSLHELRISGVTTNIPFLRNVLQHPAFLTQPVTTSFIPSHPELFKFAKELPRVETEKKLLGYLGNLFVNGPSTTLGTDLKPSTVFPNAPLVQSQSADVGWRKIYKKKGPEAFARAIRKHKGVLVTDTTWRDAHQSLLATRVRTKDLKTIAPLTSHYLSNCLSLEMWGGATFDVALRFLRECPWDRLAELRELVPNIPFQMLLRGANAVGYKGYPDNVVFKFCEQSVKYGMDIFRIFDSLNYLPNMQLGIDAIGSAGGIVEAAISYTGDVSDPSRTKYNLDYYLQFAYELSKLGIHILAIKDMAGLLKPKAASMLVKALRKEFPHLPIHVHTHDTAGSGVAAMIAAAEAGADAVDLAVDSMSGMTSQPSMGAFVESVKGTKFDSGLDPDKISELSNYWENTRNAYAPFECTVTMKAGSSDVYHHEIPGGQYTNLHFQAFALGLSSQWAHIKKAYAQANKLLGDIVKVTPSSKVVGDLAQFMVQNKLSYDDVLAKAPDLNFPVSVVEYFRGELGQPTGGFPEPLRTHVLRGAKAVEGRPGESLPPFDFDDVKKALEQKYPDAHIREVDVTSFALYPQVFDEYMQFKSQFGEMQNLETRHYLVPAELGENIVVQLEKGHKVIVRISSVGNLTPQGSRRVHFKINGIPRSLLIVDNKSSKTIAKRDKADSLHPGHVGAPMPGKVVNLMVEVGKSVEKGKKIAVLSAMKMQTVVVAPITGTVERVCVKVNDEISGGDLMVVIKA